MIDVKKAINGNIVFILDSTWYKGLIYGEDNAAKEPERQYGVNAIGSATVLGIQPGMNKANVDASVLLWVATRWPNRKHQ